MLDLLNAMNHGHGGCLFSLHANSLRYALARIERMTGMGNPETAVGDARGNHLGGGLDGERLSHRLNRL